MENISTGQHDAFVLRGDNGGNGIILYEIEQKLGSGGFAVVYKAKVSNRAVAVKMVERQDDSLMVEAAVMSHV